MDRGEVSYIDERIKVQKGRKRVRHRRKRKLVSQEEVGII